MSEPDALLPDGSEPDSDQLPLEDTLEGRAVGDRLDEGYSPPEHPRANHWGETALEESLGEGLDRRLAQEQPEAWDPQHRAPVGSEEDRTGRLAVDDDEDADPTGSGSQHYLADDVGVAGGGASAEEAAMHLVPDDEPLGGEDPAPGTHDGQSDDELPDDGRTLDDDNLSPDGETR